MVNKTKNKITSINTSEIEYPIWLTVVNVPTIESREQSDYALEQLENLFDCYEVNENVETI